MDRLAIRGGGPVFRQLLTFWLLAGQLGFDCVIVPDMQQTAYSLPGVDLTTRQTVGWVFAVIFSATERRTQRRRIRPAVA